MVKTVLSGGVDTISSARLNTLIKSRSAVVLDSREREEYTVSHIATARWVGYESFARSAVDDLSKNDTIVVTCAIGKRSEDIGLKLKEAGFNKVFNHFGGIFDWVNNGYPVVNERDEHVFYVHPYSSFWGIWINNFEKSYEPR